jgi:hypothetical protein
VALRLLRAGLHPDHNSVCTFRRASHALLKSSFESVLTMAAQMRILTVGPITLALGGTKILGNATKHSAVSHVHATDGESIPCCASWLSSSQYREISLANCVNSPNSRGFTR